MNVSRSLVLTTILLWMPTLSLLQAKECIAVIPAGSGNHFWRSVESGAKQAGLELGYDIFFRIPHDELAIAEQGTLLHEAMTKKCRALVLAPNSPTRMEEIKLFNTQHIPVVVIDREMQLQPVYAKVMTDNYKAGQQAAALMIAKLGGQGKVTVLRLQQGVTSTDQREQGFIDTIQQSAIQLLPPAYMGTDVATIRFNTNRYLEQHLDSLDGLFTPNEMTTLGAMVELRRRNQAGKIIHIGFDYDRFLMQALSKGEIEGLMLQQPYELGYQGVVFAVAALQGTPSPTQTIHTDVYYLTKEKINTDEAQRFLNLNADEGSTLQQRKARQPSAKDFQPHQ